MTREILNFGKVFAMGLTIAVSTISCRDDNPNGGGITPENPTIAQPIFNFAYRVTGAGANADWSIQALTEAEVKKGDISFEGLGYNLGMTRTNEIITSNNGNFVYILNQGNSLITKYKYSSAKNNENKSVFLEKIGEIDTRIFGNTLGNLKKIDDKTAIYYTTSAEAISEGRPAVFKNIRTEFKIVKIDLENFTFDSRSLKRMTFDNLNNGSSGAPNLHIVGIQSPVVSNGKIYFAVEKAGYDPTKGAYGRGSLIRTQDYNTTTFVLDYPSLENHKEIVSTTAKGSSTFANVFYAPSLIKTENNDLYHLTVRKGKIHKIVNGAYDNSYEFDLKTALGESVDLSISGIFYTANNIAYVMYAPDTAITQGGIRYMDGKAVWGIARVDLNAKTAIKMNVTNNLWLTFHQSSRFVDGKLYMALCPMTGDGNVYIFDPKKADANGFEKGAILKSAGGAIYVGIF